MDKLKLNPVRLYAVAVAVMAVVAHYLPSLPTALYLGLVAAILGVGGEAVHRKVTPVQRADDQATAVRGRRDQRLDSAFKRSVS